MIEKWKIVPHSSEMQPGRYRVYIKCDPGDIGRVVELVKTRTGASWHSHDPEYTYSFYIYDLSPDEVESIDTNLKKLQSGIAASPAEPEPAASQTAALAEAVKSPDEGASIEPGMDALPHPDEQKATPDITARPPQDKAEQRELPKPGQTVSFDVFEADKIEDIKKRRDKK
jgi:hypothetical protein